MMRNLRGAFAWLVLIIYFAVPAGGQNVPVLEAKCSSPLLPGGMWLSPAPQIEFHVRVDREKRQLVSTLKYALTAWIALGFSEQGRMIGSTAVIGTPSSTGGKPMLYELGGTDVSAISLLSNQTIEAGSSYVEAGTDGSTVMRSTLQESFRTPFLQDGPVTFIYAVGYTMSFQHHRYRGSFRLNLFQCEDVVDGVQDDVVEDIGNGHDDKEAAPVDSVQDEGGIVDNNIDMEEDDNTADSDEDDGVNTPGDETKSGGVVPDAAETSTNENREIVDYAQTLFDFHGLFAVFAFAVSFPVAVVSAYFRPFFPRKWIYVHLVATAGGCILTVLAIAFAFSGISVRIQEGVDGSRHMGAGHHWMGLFLFIVISIQVFGGFARPPLEEKNTEEDNIYDIPPSVWIVSHDDSTQALHRDNTHPFRRDQWRKIHGAGGAFIVVLGVIQMHTGFVLYSDAYKDGNRASVKLLWSYVSILSVLAAVAAAIAKVKSPPEPSTSPHTPHVRR